MKLLWSASVIILLACASGCVNVDLGQASKDWSEVGKSFADGYKGGAPAAGRNQGRPSQAAPQP